ncbi:scavenger receptor class A member 3-like [Melozone crissalis]|uniref:scavenger receptor class A member 3-like n=1 Tax=Melozone crissalis TaxID=40204 RepID=UPI0023DC8F79|nr:scavenger receptor class A member 3-like [Melozone crissalis]
MREAVAAEEEEEEEEARPPFGPKGGGHSRSQSRSRCRRDPGLGAAVRILFGMAAMILAAVATLGTLEIGVGNGIGVGIATGVRIMIGNMIGLILAAMATLGALAFRRVDSISADISSAQASWERGILSLHQELQARGRRSSSGNGSVFWDAAALGRELSELQRELSELRETLQAQEFQLEQTARSQARLASAGSDLSMGLEICSDSLGSIGRSLERLRDWAGECQGGTARLRNSLRDLAWRESQLGAAVEPLNSSLAQNSRRLRELRENAAEGTPALRAASAEGQSLTRLLGTLRADSSRSADRLRSFQAGPGPATRETSRNSEGLQEPAAHLLAPQPRLDGAAAQLEEQRDGAREPRRRRAREGRRGQERPRELRSRLESLREELRSVEAGAGGAEAHVRATLRFLEAARDSCGREPRGHGRELREMSRDAAAIRAGTEEPRERSGILAMRLEPGVRNPSLAVREMRAVDARHGEMLRNASEIRGVPGLPGPRGPEGDTGRGGAPGAAGPGGGRGDWGAPGAPGAPPGAAGPRGEPGPSGAPGSPGPQGAKGGMGLPGARGQPGTPGGSGAPGAEGRDCREHRGHRDRPGHRGHRGRPDSDQDGDRRHRDHRERPEPAGRPGQPGNRGQRGSPGRGESRECRDCRDHPGHRDRRDHDRDRDSDRGQRGQRGSQERGERRDSDRDRDKDRGTGTAGTGRARGEGSAGNAGTAGTARATGTLTGTGTQR